MGRRRARHTRQRVVLFHISPFGWVVIGVIAMCIIARLPGGGA
jgi:hypothetical protein